MIAGLLAALLATGVTDDAVVGRWMTETRHGIVEIARCGASLCGRLVTSDGLRAHPGVKDANNRDPRLRDRPIAGMLILQGFSPGAGGVWDGGTVYDAESGRSYAARITPLDADHLRLRGCVFVPLCRSQTWTRLR